MVVTVARDDADPAPFRALGATSTLLRPVPTTAADVTPTTTVTTTIVTPTTVPRWSGRFAFPIRTDGPVSYSRTHAGYEATDIFTACGNQVVAVTDGEIVEVSTVDRWEPATDDPALRSGLFVSLVGGDGVRYYASHLQEVATGLAVGRRVAVGEPIGLVGRSGNARDTPCHVHFGISPPGPAGDWELRRGVVAPWPYLDAWKAGEHRSARDAVADWQRSHPSGRP